MSTVTWSNNSLVTGNVTRMKSSSGVSDKKRYFEIEILASASPVNLVVGICAQDYVLTEPPYTSSKVRIYGGGGEKSNPRASYGAIYTINDVISVLIDFEENKIEFWKNGVSQGVAFTTLSTLTSPIYALVSSGNSNTHSYKANFGASPFKYDMPSHYLSFDGNQSNVKNLVVNNRVTNKFYSLSDKTLIPLPNASDKNMILHGIEAGKEIKLDEDFDKINYPVEGTVVKTIVKPLSIKFE